MQFSNTQESIIKVDPKTSSDRGDAIKLEKSSSISPEKGGVHTRKNLISVDDECGYYHYVEALKVLGVHKQEQPRVHHLFVVVVKWNDKNQVTVYRKWKEIKEFQHAILKVIKAQKDNSDAYRFIKKTACRVKTTSRFRHGTIKKLEMIDSLNSFFEALVHYGDKSDIGYIRRFFKPTESDLDCELWSGSGRTYLYVTPNALGQRNDDFDPDNNNHEFSDDATYGINVAKHINEHNNAIQFTDGQLNDALDKYNEADPNISWPMTSTIFTAICDFVVSSEDPKDHIIGLTKGEGVEVLEKSDTGWWLVKRINEESKTEDGRNEFGYVPAGFLEIQNKIVVARTPFSSRDESSVEIDDDIFSSASFHTGVFEDTAKRECTRGVEPSIDERKTDESVPLSKLQLLQKLQRVESFGSLSSHDSDWTVSTFTSMESLSSPVGSPTPKSILTKFSPRPISPLAQDYVRFTPSRPRHLFHSESLPIACPRGSMTPPVMTRSQTLDSNLGSRIGLISDVTNRHSRSLSSSPTLSLSSSSTKHGTTYVSTKAYHAINDDELSFETGSVIKVIGRNRNGWWLAKYKGKTGLVPSVNLRRYKDPIRTMMGELS